MKYLIAVAVTFLLACSADVYYGDEETIYYITQLKQVCKGLTTGERILVREENATAHMEIQGHECVINIDMGVEE